MKPKLREDDLTMQATTFKPGDVLRYSPYRHHCCDTTAVVDDRGVAFDTYWSHDGRPLTVAELETAEVVFNVNEYEKVKYREQWEKYSPDDRERISSQHGCYENLYVRKGAQHDLPTQIANAQERVAEAESNLRSAQHALEWAQQDLAKLREAA